METTKQDKIILYGAAWCGDCVRSKAYLDSIGCEYEYIDIAEDESAVAKVLEINNGMKSIPTTLFPDGKVLVEPSNQELEEEIKSLEKNNLVVLKKN